VDINIQKPQNSDSTTDTEQEKVAVPYIPPPPPEESSQKRFRSPIINGMMLATVILLAGFMAYNFAGHQLTQLAGESDVNIVSPSPIPTDTPVPTISYAPSPTQ